VRFWLLALFLASVACFAATASTVEVELLETGDAICSFTVEVVDAPAVVSVRLAGEPYLVEAYGSGGEEVPFKLYGNVLELYVLENTTVTVRCLTSLASRSGDVWVAEVALDSPFKLVLPEGAVVVELEPVPEEVKVEGNRAALYYAGGRARIEYLQLAQKAGQEQKQEPSPEAEAESPTRQIPATALAVATIVALALSLYILLKASQRRRP